MHQRSAFAIFHLFSNASTKLQFETTISKPTASNPFHLAPLKLIVLKVSASRKHHSSGKSPFRKFATVWVQNIRCSPFTEREDITKTFDVSKPYLLASCTRIFTVRTDFSQKWEVQIQ